MDRNSAYIMPGGLELSVPTVIESDPWVLADESHHFRLPEDDSDLDGTALAIFETLELTLN